MHALGCAMAVERRLAEPADVKDVLQPPLAHYWAKAVPVLQAFVQDPAADWKPVAELLARF